MEAHTIAGREDRRHARAHPRVDVGHEAAERGDEAQTRADEVQQLDVRHHADGPAHGVARDLALAARDGRAVVIHSDDHHGLDLARAPARRLDRVRREERHAARGQRLGGRRVAANLRVDLDDAHDLHPVLDRNLRGVKAERARAEDEQAARRQGAISREQRGGSAGTQSAGALPAGKAQQHVARAGGDDQPVIAEQPRAAIVGEPEHRHGQLLHGGPVDEGAPDVGAELHVDTGLVCARQLGVRLDHALEHQRTVAHGAIHPLAEAERDVHRHHVVVDGVLVDQHHLDTDARRLDRGRDAGGPGSDHDQRHVAIGRGHLTGDRPRIGLAHQSSPAAAASTADGDAVQPARSRQSRGVSAKRLSVSAPRSAN